MIDLLKLDYAQLKELGQQVAQQIASAKQQKIQHAGEQIKEMAKSLDMSVQELLEQSGVLDPKQKKADGASTSGAKVPPLYRNPEDASKTWSGRGRQPGWVEKHRAGGGNLDDLRIKG